MWSVLISLTSGWNNRDRLLIQSSNFWETSSLYFNHTNISLCCWSPVGSAAASSGRLWWREFLSSHLWQDRIMDLSVVMTPTKPQNRVQTAHTMQICFFFFFQSWKNDIRKQNAACLKHQRRLYLPARPFCSCSYRNSLLVDWLVAIYNKTKPSKQTPRKHCVLCQKYRVASSGTSEWHKQQHSV